MNVTINKQSRKAILCRFPCKTEDNSVNELEVTVQYQVDGEYGRGYVMYVTPQFRSAQYPHITAKPCLRQMMRQVPRFSERVMFNIIHDRIAKQVMFGMLFEVIGNYGITFEDKHLTDWVQETWGRYQA